MKVQSNQSANACPEVATVQTVRKDAYAAFDEVVRFCETCDSLFWVFEEKLLVRMAALGCCLIRLFFAARHQRLDVQPYLEDGQYRAGEPHAERTLKTFYGAVTYVRQYLLARKGGSGFAPLDVVLGLTRDRLSPWVMQWVARLATRMSFKASQMVCKAVLHRAPATETMRRSCNNSSAPAKDAAKCW